MKSIIHGVIVSIAPYPGILLRSFPCSHTKLEDKVLAAHRHVCSWCSSGQRARPWPPLHGPVLGDGGQPAGAHILTCMAASSVPMTLCSKPACTEAV